MPDPVVVTARLHSTGQRVRVAIDGPTIASVEPDEAAGPGDDLDPWIVPAFWDLQVNGRWGVSFSDATITPEQVARIARAQAALGTARFCPTLITASQEAMLAGVRAIASACDADPDIDRRVLGIHLEGPWISPEDGYRGAHPRDHVRAPDWAEFQELQRASGSRVVLVTLAPERPGVLDLIGRLAETGVAVAVGHSAADGAAIDAAIRAGAKLSTHLGNGVPALLPRHPNAIWAQAAREELWASFIADGHHLDAATLRVLLLAKAPRFLLVSDASPLAGSPPGLYGPWEVLDDGRIVVAGTPYLAGSNVTLLQAVENLAGLALFTPQRAFEAATSAPALILDRTPPAVAVGEPSELVIFRASTGQGPPTFQLLATHCGGAWTLAGDGA